jgi:manganese/iron transport system substrate-binding protein
MNLTSPMATRFPVPPSRAGVKFSLLLSAIALLTSCNNSAMQAPTSKPQVIASYSVLCDLTDQIAQDTIDLKCLIPGGTDAHVYNANPSDRRSLETGSLILYGGYGFEPEVIKLIKAANPKNAIAVHELAVPNPILSTDDHGHGEEHPETDHKGKKDKKDKKDKAEPDPHVWHNVKNGIAIVQVLKTQLSQISPENATRYEKNAKELTDRLTQLDQWILKSIATIPNTSKKLITTHDALNYYSQAYGIPIEGALQGISTTEKPSAQRIAALVATVKSTQVSTLFAELNLNPKLIATVAQEANVKLSPTPLIADGLGEPGSSSDTYEKMMRENTKAIVTGLGGLRIEN